MARGKTTALVVTVITGAGSGLLAVIQAWLLSRALGEVFLGQQDLVGQTNCLALLGAVLAMRLALSITSEWMAAGLAGEIKQDLRRRLLVKLTRMGPLGVGRENPAELTTVVTRGVGELEAYFAQFLPQVFLAGLIPAGILFFVFPLDPLSGIVLMLTGPLIPLFMYLIGSNVEKLTGRQFARLRLLSAGMFDRIAALPVLKGLGRSLAVVREVRRLSEEYRDATLQVLRITFLSALALEWLGTISTAVIAVEVGLRLLAGYLPFEQAFFLVVIAPDFYQPLRTLGLRFHASMQGISAAGRIFEVLNLPELLPAAPRQPQAVPVDWSEISLENVSFAYPGQTQAAIDHLTLNIPRGAHIGLAGPSGSGKSTLNGLLLRLLSPSSGQIRVGSTPLREIAAEEWRRDIVWIPQKPYFSPINLRSYFQRAQPDLTDSLIWDLLAQTGLDERVNKSASGLNLRLGESGAGFSSGELRRLAIARAMAGEAGLVIMDEPFAHVDALDIPQLSELLRRFWAGRTVVCIAHQRRTLNMMDRVAVLYKGSLAGYAPPQTLQVENDVYRRLAGLA